MRTSSEAVYTVLSSEDFTNWAIGRTLQSIFDNPGKFYLLSPDSGLRLHEAIALLADNCSDGAELTQIRFAQEIIFTLRVYLQTGDNEKSGLDVGSLSELLSFLQYDNAMRLTRNDFHVVVDDSGRTDDDEEARKAVADIFQQMIYLNIDIDIKRKSEIQKSIVKDRFRARHQELRSEVVRMTAKMDEILSAGKMTATGLDRVQKMKDALLRMLDALDDGRKRPIKIAAMGTRKAGKSVIINDILKRDYAPTSSELPTPNVVKYIPEPEGTPLTLDYQGKSIEFSTPEELSKYILGEFEKAMKHTGEGSGLEDMTVHYPSDDFSGYEVWDTPGPNFAGAGDEHRKIAENCIMTADVCIFVDNYSTHLTDDAEKFLSQIHKVFTDNNKFYSLLIVINRIDERYSSEVEKSVSRLVDYIRLRLEALGYKNIVMFGTSALQSFYTDKVLELAKAHAKPGESLVDTIATLKRTHKRYMTPLKFVETSLGNLRDFHNIDHPTADDLQAFSGIPQLERYLKYIGDQKVDSEIVYNVISRCESLFDAIRNANLISHMLELSDEDKKYLVELGKLLDGLKIYVDSVIDGVRHLVEDSKISAALYNVVKASDSGRTEILGLVDGLCRDAVNSSELDGEDIRQVKAGSLTDNMRAITTKIAEAIAGLNRRSAETVARMAESESRKYGHDVEAGIQKARAMISAKTDEIRAKVSNAAAKQIMQEFSIPDFPPSLNKMSFTAQTFGAEVDSEFLRAEAQRSSHIETHTEYRTETVTKTRTKTRERKKRGFWEHVTFWKKRYETYEENYQEEIQKPYTVSSEVYDIDGFRRSIIGELQRRVRDVVEKAHKEIGVEAERITRSIYANIGEQCKAINDEYREIFESFREDIRTASDNTSQHKAALESDIEILREIDESFAPFFTLWNEIRYGGFEEAS